MCQGNDLANPPRHLLPDERLVLGGHGASGQWWTRQGMCILEVQTLQELGRPLG